MIQTALLIAIILLMLGDKLKNSDKESKITDTQTVVMDTSALIDGRVVEVIKSGFLSGNFIVTKRVLNELQLLADGKDSHKRERARYGLDVVAELQTMKSINVSIDDFMVQDDIPTDESLLLLAKKRRAMLFTTDFNLNKVASVEGVKVLNVNELAQSLRPRALPGEVIEIKIIQKGEGKGQGVGYLDDGTMTVVDNASRMKGKTIKATVDRMIQTKAGKMVFATYSK